MAIEILGNTGADWAVLAIAVVLSAVAHRLAFGYPIIGRARGRGLLDMSPFEREELCTTKDSPGRQSQTAAPSTPTASPSNRGFPTSTSGRTSR